MFKFHKTLVVIFFCCVSLASCTTTIVRGKKLVSTNIQQINKLIILTDPYGEFDARTLNRYQSTSAVTSGRIEINNLFPHLLRRVPMVFSLNGIESVAFNGGTGNGVPKGELDGFREILLISPKAATDRMGNLPVQSGGTVVTISLKLFRRDKNILIWSGEITMGKTGGGFDEDLADECAKKLLLQLNKDGMIKLTDTQIKFPDPSK